MTTGVLIQRLLRDSHLYNIGVVILDEFHERNLDRWVRGIHYALSLISDLICMLLDS